MLVLGMNGFIFEITVRTCSLKPFSGELGIAENVPIFDVVIAYDFQYSHKNDILIIRNALYIPTMQHNLIPAIILHQVITTYHFKAMI